MTKLIYPSLEEVAKSFTLLDLIPDTHAWVKDPQGRFVCGNRLFFSRFGFTTLRSLLGKTDYDLALAEQYGSDDLQVLNGSVVNDRLELIVAEGQGGDWFLTSKWPIYDAQAHILGKRRRSARVAILKRIDKILQAIQG
mgnify:CR=1 FL=1